MNADTYALTGAFVGTFTTEYSTRREGRPCKVLTTWEVIDLGRPDRTPLVDPEAQLVEEDLHEDVYAEARERARRQLARFHADLRVQVVAYLKANGPTDSTTLAKRLNRNRNGLISHMQARRDIYTCERPARGFALWGLVGVDHE